MAVGEGSWVKRKERADTVRTLLSSLASSTGRQIQTLPAKYPSTTRRVWDHSCRRTRRASVFDDLESEQVDLSSVCPVKFFTLCLKCISIEATNRSSGSTSPDWAAETVFRVFTQQILLFYINSCTFFMVFIFRKGQMEQQYLNSNY